MGTSTKHNIIISRGQLFPAHLDRTLTNLLSPLVVNHVDIDKRVLGLVQHIAVLEGQDGGGTAIEPEKTTLCHMDYHLLYSG